MFIVCRSGWPGCGCCAAAFGIILSRSWVCFPVMIVLISSGIPRVHDPFLARVAMPP